jgi:hypothetical protein
MSVHLDHWREWKRICSVAGCGTEVRAGLEDYLTGCAVEAAKALHYDSYRPQEVPAAHLFDMHVATGTVKSKPTKDWMWERSLAANTDAARLRNLNINASLLLRTALRNQERGEGHEYTVAPSVRVVSKDRPISDSGGDTLGELISGLSFEVGQEETDAYAEIARDLFPSFKEEVPIDPRDACILLASALGLGMNNRVVNEVTGRQKSVLSTRRLALRDTIKTWLEKKFPEEDPAARFYLMGHLMVVLLESLQNEILETPAGQALLAEADRIAHAAPASDQCMDEEMEHEELT